jgi:hypothetical protein
MASDVARIEFQHLEARVSVLEGEAQQLRRDLPGIVGGAVREACLRFADACRA